MSDTTVVAGDVHLGAASADRTAFESFLDTLLVASHTVDRLVLLGDVWDLVRRDPFGCAWETSETITRLKRLTESIDVHLVFGNHDTHLRALDASRYDIALHDEYSLRSGDVDIRFCHGQQFDRFQADRLSAHLSGPGDRGEIDPTGGLKTPLVEGGRRFLHRQRERLRRLRTDAPGSGFPARERRAHAFLDSVPEDKLVYGHTHQPYVRADNTVANPGAWDGSPDVSNTYLLVEDGTIELVRHEIDGRDEPVEGTRPLPGP